MKQMTFAVFPEMAGSSSVIAQSSLFIFRPGEPAPSGNVFASWAALVAAAALVVGPKAVYFDNTLAPCSIPAGAWDFVTCTAFFGCDGLPTGSGGPNTTPLTIDDGATLANVFEFRSLDITCASTTSVILTPLFGAHYYLSGTTRLTQVGVGGAFLSSGTGFVFSPVVVTLLDFAEIVTGVAPALSVTAVGANISVVAFDNSTVGTDTIGSVVGGFPVGSVESSALFSALQAGIPGGIIIIQLLSAAIRVSYTDTPPLLGASNVQDAIDALKAGQPIETGEYLPLPEGRVAAQGIRVNAATFGGGSLILRRRVSASQLIFRLTAVTAGSRVRVLLFQTPDGGSGIASRVASATTGLLGVGAQNVIVTFAEGTVLFEKGLIYALYGLFAAPGSTMRVYTTDACDLLTSSVDAATHPTTFTTAILSTTLPATFNPLPTPGGEATPSTVNICPVIRLLA